MEIGKLKELYRRIDDIKDSKTIIHITNTPIMKWGLMYTPNYGPDEDFINKLSNYNIILNYRFFNSIYSPFSEYQSYDLYINKLKFILDYEEAINSKSLSYIHKKYKITYIEDVINKINDIGFEKFYNEILLDGKYKIKDIRYFVYYIYVLNDIKKNRNIRELC